MTAESRTVFARSGLRRTLAGALLSVVVTVMGLATPATPVRISGLKSEYCTNAKLIVGTLENNSKEYVFVSLSVERRDADGRWTAYVEDVFASEPFPRKVRSVRVESGASRTVDWRPIPWAKREALGDGSYRLMGYVVEGSNPAGKKYVLAKFAVKLSACKQ